MYEITAELLERDRLDLNDARWVLGEVTRRIVNSQELDGWWEGYESVAMAFAASENVCARSMAEMRKSLEYVRPFQSSEADERICECLIAASKMVLSAVIVFSSNPTGGLYQERDPIHDDLDPLIRKAVEILHGVAEAVDENDVQVADTSRYVVEFDAEHPQRMKARNDRNRVQFLIDNAIRPPV
jgi:hypothetical protein